ncbi:transcriptional regulator with XRE-family HTH domain [Saccharothrix tamanrassetensis]|uniref:Transcriptional regulator with XRE-family HTH domain n=1 Tax=Saccharothrix tamanrassetensis TaxID=1051531 RepID=A0A841CGL7_9PSEU|nr:helix-turn-helix transcriptional regulator [Saccharothrix tamanrassetensis]MBB5956491.1 transcriptional regulator with XRE-family HTH domain [Saccharothrix tamanrassetensis]
MARRPGPSVRSRRLAITLRKLRRATGMTGADVAKAVDMSGSKLSRVESADSGIYLDDVEKLLDFYGVTKKQRVYLLDLARHAEQRGLLRINNANLPGADWQTWADFEEEANGLLFYEPMMIPGLLQTTEYANAIIKATGHHLTADEIEALVASRKARQGMLSRSDPLRLHAIIEQSAIERRFGGPGAHARQVRHLLDTAELPNVTVQVLPADAEVHSAMTGAFVILEYDEEASLVLLENKISSLFLDEPEQIEVFETTWSSLRELAYTPVETVEFLKRLA